MLREIEVDLLKVYKQCASLFETTHKHLHHLSELIDNSFTYDSHQFRAEDETLEDELTEFLKDFRRNRKEVSKIIEHIMNAEEFVCQLNIFLKK
jgi:hypothetical protein